MKSRRLFFALWPNQAERQAVLKLQKSLTASGRPVTADNIHITLAFLGSVAEDPYSSLLEQAETISAEPFKLQLDQLVYWKRAGIFSLQPSELPGALMSLKIALDTVLSIAGFSPESRRYRPHVTLFRGVTRRPPEPGVEALDWSVESFCLVESVSIPGGVEYRVLRSWPLDATPK